MRGAAGTAVATARERADGQHTAWDTLLTRGAPESERIISNLLPLRFCCIMGIDAGMVDDRPVRGRLRGAHAMDSAQVGCSYLSVAILLHRVAAEKD